MAKGSGRIRAGSSPTPKGHGQASVPTTRGYSQEQADIDSLNLAMSEAEAEQEVIQEETDRLYREMDRDPDNSEYYSDQIAQYDSTYKELEAQITSYERQIDEIQKELEDKKYKA